MTQVSTLPTAFFSHIRGWLGVSSAIQWFVSCFIYFLCSELIWTSSFIHNVGFYLFLLPAFFIAWKKYPSLVKNLPRNFGTITLGCFFLYAALQGLVLRHTGQSVVTIEKDTILTSLFVLMVLAVFHRDQPEPFRLLRLLVLVAFACSVVSIAAYIYYDMPEERLFPIGRAHNPIPAANVYASSALIAAYLFFRAPYGKRWRWLAALCVVVVTLMVFLTGSRGPLLSLLGSYGVLLLVLRQWKIIGVFAVLSALLAGDYAYYVTQGTSLLHAQSLYGLVQELFVTRDSYRLAIWTKTIGLIQEQPWLGYGMRAPFQLEGVSGAINPHNVFLATAFYMGLPGLLLLLLPLGAAFVTALRRLHQGYYQLVLVLLIHAVAAVFTDLAQPVQSPAPLWTIFWLPIALALARPQKDSVGQA